MSVDNTVRDIPATGAPGLSREPPVPRKVSYRNQTWNQAAGQHETVAALARLPEGLTFPEDFPEPIRYDAGRKRLVYRGFMYSGSYTYLRQFSGDTDYLTALDHLFVGSSAPHEKRSKRPLVALTLAALAFAVALWLFLR